MVPQLNDNIRLTIDEYRNKLYQFIQNKPISRLSAPAQQTQKTKAQKSQQSYSRTTQKLNHNEKIDSELIDHYANQAQKNNYASSYNQYDSKSSNEINYNSDDNSSTPTPPSPANYNHMASSSTSALNNYNRKKHTNDYQNNTNVAKDNLVSNGNSTNLNYSSILINYIFKFCF